MLEHYYFREFAVTEFSSPLRVKIKENFPGFIKYTEDPFIYPPLLDLVLIVITAVFFLSVTTLA